MIHEYAKPNIAPAWLAVHEYPDGGTRWIHAIAERPGDEEILRLVADLPTWAGDPRLIICRDSADLKANHSGIWIRSPADISARDTWFQRFWQQLEPHLKDPQIAQVFTYSSASSLQTPFDSYRSTAQGPFYFPNGRQAPKCQHCGLSMAFIGCLSTQAFQRFLVPGQAMILHGCTHCGVCDDTVELTWVNPRDSFSVVGQVEKPQIRMGAKWTATEYPTPAFYAKDLSDDPFFNEERSIYQNFACFGDKIEGHIFWIQGDCTPTDSTGQAMQFVGQFTGSEDVEIGDSGLAYVFHSPTTNESRVVIQYF